MQKKISCLKVYLLNRVSELERIKINKGILIAMRFELTLEWLKVTYFTVKLSSLSRNDI